jgi:raffinose/stachyose/melibiose transport system permease protein
MNMTQKARKWRWKDHWFYFTIPALVIYVWFMAFPLFNSMRLSLYTGSGLVPTKFVGLQNYVELFTNPLYSDRLVGALKNTFILFGVCMAIQNTLGLMFANILSGRIRFGAAFRTLIFLPATMSVLVTGFLWKLILNPQWGAVNYLLVKMGLEQFRGYPWLGKPEIAMIVVSLVVVWQWVGNPTMIFLAGLQGISIDIVEAAAIDGASATQVFWKVKFPLLAPVIGVVTILTFVGNFNAFDIVFALTNARGAPEYSTDIMGTLFYRIAIAGEHPVAQPNMGVGASIATVTFFILLAGVSLWLYFRERAVEGR